MRETPSPVAFPYTITQRDYFLANLSVALRGRAVWTTLAIWTGCLGLVLGISFFIGPFIGPGLIQEKSFIQALTALSVGLWVIGVVTVPVTWLINVSRAWSSDPNASGPFTCTLTQAGIQVVAPGGRMELMWTSLTSVVETKDFIFFHQRPGSSATFVPKSALSARMLQDLRRIALNALSERAHLKE